ncbi:hypothetical protein ACHAWT_010471 [Skeletonema menzelii]|mmetsp:Transcript_3518/g.5851  ORF Transcript_3518/g.5851 Transcript_3518/m.5851 type:complete len:777 (+) Transcript_3518:55-2385(+)
MTDILHSSLLKGTLSIKVSDTDIRRTASGIAGSSAIETDYILCIAPTNKVKFSETQMKLSTASSLVDELKTYYCSKRYVDLRHLAKAMQEHAVEVVNFYAKKGGSERDLLGTGALVKNVKDFAHFITNTEQGKSNVATDLDSLSRKKANKSTSDVMSSAHRRTSTALTQLAPFYIRKVLEGVDDFFECIFAEKRQFGGKKTNIDYVKQVAARRQKIIDEAFEKFLDALAIADLDQMVKSQEVPKSMMNLVESMKKFLLTDVVEDNSQQGEHNHSSGSLSSEDYVDVNDSPSTPPKDEAPARGRPAMVKAMSTRHRMSGVDREEEEKECALETELVIAESVDVGGRDHAIKTTPPSSPKAKEARKKNIAHAPPPIQGMLPEDPLEFGIIVVVGTVFFKLLQGRTMELQIDVLALFGIACGLIGYQIAVSSDTTEIVVDYSPTKKRVSIAEPTPDVGIRPRPPMMKSTRSRMLIEKSSLIMKSMRFSSIGAEEDEEPKEAVPLRTFDTFPEGAKIGSHLNCWSCPPSSNFHVRGPNYLTDKKKVPSEDFIFPTRGCDLFLTDNPPVNIGRYEGILNGKLREKPTFIINYRLPWGVFISYHEIPERFIPFLRKRHGHGSSAVPLPSMEGMTPGEQAMCNFLLSDSEEKDEVLKIVPVVVEGPWVVKKVVGGKPAIIGTKLPISYVYQPPEKGLCEYLEADLDIVSSAAARNILAVVRSYTQVLTIDLGFVVQGNKSQYLPEQMMLGLRLHGLDPLTAELLPESHHDVPHLTDDDDEETD